MNFEQRAEGIRNLLRERGKEPRLTDSRMISRRTYHFYQLQLGERTLAFAPDSDVTSLSGEDVSGYIHYGDTNWTVHCYGSFPPSDSQLQQAADYLLNPQTPPPSITEDVETIVNGLIAKGVKKEEIAIDWSRRPDMPVISRGNYRVEFGLYSPGTMNVFQNGNKDNTKWDRGLVYPKQAIEYLNRGLCKKEFLAK